MYTASKYAIGGDDSVRVLVCGNNSDGQLGLGGVDEEEYVGELKSVNWPFDKPILDIACGVRHTLILLSDGSLYSCGNNDAGQLGRGHDMRRKPGLIAHLEGLRVVQACCGSTHSVALVDDGHIFAWGSNSIGQLGVSTLRSSDQNFIVEPQEINLSEIVQVACGSLHTLAIGSDGVLHAWGDNKHGQIGIGSEHTVFNRPQSITSLAGVPVKSVFCGHSHSFAVSLSGAVFGWGKNKYGQLGCGDTNDRFYPMHIKALRSQRIVHISCGDDHTAALTLDGRLFTFGASMYGQLGHGSVENEVLPKQVMELMGSKVLHVACGRCHTLVIVNDSLYAFGLAGSGQLATLGTRLNRLTPTILNSRFYLKRIFAGGDHTVAFCSEKRDVNSQLLPSPQRGILCFLDVTRIKLYATMQTNKVLSEIETIFSSPSCICASFLKSGDCQYATGSKNSGINMDEAVDGFEILSSLRNYEQIQALIKSSLEILFSQLLYPPPDIEALRLYLILPCCHVFNKPDSYQTLHYPLAASMHRLGSVSWKIIEQWWKTFETRHLNRILKIFKGVVAHLFGMSAYDFNANRPVYEEVVRACLEVLKHVNKVNAETRKLPFNAFYINELTNAMDVRVEYVKFMHDENAGRFTICNYSFIFNGEVKTLLLQTDTQQQMQMMIHSTQQQNISSLYFGFPPQVDFFLSIVVSRKEILRDTINALSACSPLDLKKPLKVEFRGEEAEDAGGVKKEFFMLLFQELLHPKYGMFTENPESRLLWFSHLSYNDPQNYQLVGILVGLAIYNSVIVNLPFPLALYKKLLNQTISLDDLKELSPTEGQSLESLLDYEEDDFEDAFCLNFTISIAVFDSVITEELKPNGANIPVTKENRAEYVEAYLEFKFTKQIADHFNAFAGEFRRVVASRVLNFFQPQELMEMVVGNENYDWDEFERNTHYEGEYWRKHPTIMFFWEVFHSLTTEEKKKFLLFLTGTTRVPLLGMKQIKMVIQPTAGGEAYYPVAHTCFNLLDLPKYQSKTLLRNKLLEAIEHNQGFTLR